MSLENDESRHRWRGYAASAVGLLTLCATLPRSTPAAWEVWGAVGGGVVGGVVGCRVALSAPAGALCTALVWLLGGLGWASTLPSFDTTLSLCTGLAVLVCFACTSYRQMSVAPKDQVWTHELMWTAGTAAAYWMCMAAALDERGMGWVYTQVLSQAPL